MDEPLVDSEGYPRADIDVYQVRNARHQIICKLTLTRNNICIFQKNLIFLIYIYQVCRMITKQL